MLSQTVVLPSTALGMDLDVAVLQQLKATLEGCVGDHGYVRRNSLALLSRTIASPIVADFGGNSMTTAVVQMDVFDPSIGDELEVVVNTINRIGVRADLCDGEVPCGVATIMKTTVMKPAGAKMPTDADTALAALRPGMRCVVQVKAIRKNLSSAAVDMICQLVKPTLQNPLA